MATSDHRQFLKHFLEDEAVLKGYLLAATGNMHETDDLMQEVSSVLWEKFSAYDKKRPFRAWALGIAKLEILKWRQRRGRSREVLSEETFTALARSAFENADSVAAQRLYLRTCLKTLQEGVRRVVRMKYFEELPVHKIAERLNKNVGAIEMLLVRVRRALRGCIERKHGAEEVRS